MTWIETGNGVVGNATEKGKEAEEIVDVVDLGVDLTNDVVVAEETDQDRETGIDLLNRIKDQDQKKEDDVRDRILGSEGMDFCRFLK